MTDRLPLAKQIAAMTRLIERCKARSAYLQGHHGRASILIESNDFAAMREILATLEQHERAVAALRQLATEVGGSWAAFEAALRQDIGNTNYVIISNRLELARAVIATLDAAQETDRE
jgi:hypothetical protein